MAQGKSNRILTIAAIVGLIPICCCFSYGLSRVEDNDDKALEQTESIPTEIVQDVIESTPTVELLPPTSTIEPTFSPQSTSTQALAPTKTQVVVSNLFPSVEGSVCIPNNTTRQTATIASVTDGDTIEVIIDGVIQKVRYIGIDTPESSENFGNLSRSRNYDLLVNQELTLVKDVSETDQYDRLLRYVIAGTEFVNYTLVKEGFAEAGTWAPDTSCDKTFMEAEDYARSQGLGLWALLIPAKVPTIATVPTKVPTIKPVQGQVVIKYIFYDGVVPRVESDEYVEIANTGNSPVNLKGWHINADDPGQDFFFPDMTLNPGESCRVYTNEIHPNSCGNRSFGSGQAIWNNSDRECGYLYNANGTIVSEHCY